MNAVRSDQKRIGIAFVIDAINWKTAGTEKQVLQLVERLDRRVFVPYLVVLRRSQVLEQNWRGCEVLCLNVTSLLSLQGLKALAVLSSWLRRKGVAVIQTFFKDANTLGIIAGLLARVPLRLSSRRNLKHDTSRLELLVYRLVNLFVHCHLVNGQRVKRNVIDTECVVPERVKVFHNLVDERIEAGKATVRSTTTVSKGRQAEVVFLMVANLRNVKGHALLVEAVQEVRHWIPGAKFVFVGGGPAGEEPCRTEVYKMALRSGVFEMFEFAGLQSNVKPFLDAADVGILCSSSEGFSSSLLEYIAAGLPCIATDVGCNSELVVDGFNGLLVRYGNQDQLGKALVDFYCDGGLRVRMGRNSRSHFKKNFAGEQELKRLETFYRRELGRRAAR